MRLFTRTYIKDFDWLKLAMKSVAKRVQEQVDWTIVVDRSEIGSMSLEPHPGIHVSVVATEDKWPEAMQIGNGYLRQQWIKMCAHRAIPDGVFWNWDSDVIAVKHFSSKTFYGKSERPIHWFSPYNDMIATTTDPTAKEAFLARRRLAEEIFGWPINFEWMRCMPMPMFSEIIRSGEAHHPYWPKMFDMLKANRPGFSEFNFLGEFASHFFPDAFEWRNAEIAGPTWSGGYVLQGQEIVFQEHAIVSQGYSWGGIPESVRKFVNSL